MQKFIVHILFIFLFPSALFGEGFPGLVLFSQSQGQGPSKTILLNNLEQKVKIWNHAESALSAWFHILTFCSKLFNKIVFEGPCPWLCEKRTKPGNPSPNKADGKRKMNKIWTINFCIKKGQKNLPF